MERYLSKLRECAVPEHLHDGLCRYLEHGIPPGHFLTVVLENNLYETLNRADEESRAGLFQLVMFLYNHAPSNAWGTRHRVESWMASHQMARQAP